MLYIEKVRTIAGKKDRTQKSTILLMLIALYYQVLDDYLIDLLLRFDYFFVIYIQTYKPKKISEYYTIKQISTNTQINGSQRRLRNISN